MWNRLRRTDALATGVLVAVIAACITNYLSGGVIGSFAFDTDALNIPTLVGDLIGHHGSLSHWYLSPAPYLFPDALLFVPAHFLGPDTYGRIAAYMAIHLLALWCALRWTASRAGHDRPARFAGVSVAVLAWLGIRNTAPFNQLLVPGFHGGAFIASVVLVGLCIAPVRNPSTRSLTLRMTAIACLSATATLSDSIVLIQTVAPLTLLLLVLAMRGDGNRVHRIAACVTVLVSSIAGHLSYGQIIVHHTRYPLVLTREKISANFAAVWGLVRSNFAAHGLAIPLLAVFVLLAAVMSVRVVRGTQRRGEVDNLVVWFALSVVSSTVGVGIATTNEVTIRYFLPVIAFPLLAVLLVATNSKFLAGKSAATIAVLCSVSLVGGAVGLVRENGVLISPRPAEVACIDDAIASVGGEHGIAQYWDAKYIQNLSRLDITLAQYFDNLVPMKWITTSDYYRPTYDFAVVSMDAPQPYRLSVDLITAGNGPPRSTVQCASHLVLLYGKDKLRIK